MKKPDRYRVDSHGRWTEVYNRQNRMRLAKMTAGRFHRIKAWVWVLFH